jgi:hypothetical protein
VRLGAATTGNGKFKGHDLNGKVWQSQSAICSGLEKIFLDLPKKCSRE